MHSSPEPAGKFIGEFKNEPLWVILEILPSGMVTCFFYSIPLFYVTVHKHTVARYHFSSLSQSPFIVTAKDHGIMIVINSQMWHNIISLQGHYSTRSAEKGKKSSRKIWHWCKFTLKSLIKVQEILGHLIHFYFSSNFIPHCVHWVWFIFLLCQYFQFMKKKKTADEDWERRLNYSILALFTIVQF